MKSNKVMTSTNIKNIIKNKNKKVVIKNFKKRKRKRYKNK